jgi:hypothetical protein
MGFHDSCENKKVLKMYPSRVEFRSGTGGEKLDRVKASGSVRLLIKQPVDVAMMN